MPRKATFVQANTSAQLLSVLFCFGIVCFASIPHLLFDEASAQETKDSDTISKVTLSNLRERYQGPADVRFEIDYSREHADLTVPLKFSVKYSIKGQELLWSVFRPFKEDSRKASFGVPGKDAILDAEPTDADNLALLIAAVVGMKWGEVFNKFNVRTSENGLLYSPKAESGVSYLKDISVSFYDSLRPKNVVIQFSEGRLNGIVRWFDYSSKKSEEDGQQ